MKCYSFENGSIVVGIEILSTKNTTTSVIYLGDERSRCRHKRIDLYPKDPAEIVNGKVLEARPGKITLYKNTKDERLFFILGKPQQNDTDLRILLRVNTNNGYDKFTTGGWEKLSGVPKQFVHASGEYWVDDLVILSPGDFIIVKGSDGRNWVVSHTGTIPISKYKILWDAERVMENPQNIDWE